jgi:hypothetical protein
MVPRMTVNVQQYRARVLTVFFHFRESPYLSYPSPLSYLSYPSLLLPQHVHGIETQGASDRHDGRDHRQSPPGAAAP